MTGKPPFLGNTAMDTVRAVIEQEPVPPSKLNRKLPADLETICLKCLEKQPGRRYATARALAEELERFLDHEPILAKPASAWRKTWSWCVRNPWVITAAASALILGLVGLAYYLWQRAAYSEWKLAHANQPPPFAPGWFESVITWACLQFGSMGILIVWLDLMVRRRRGQPFLRRHLWAYSVIGGLAAACGVFLVAFFQIRPKAASPDGKPSDGADLGPPAAPVSPALNHGWFEVLRSMAAAVCLAMFLALVIPDREGSRQWFSILAGVFCLPVAGWCMTHRTARPLSVISCTLILAAAAWILLASPYRVL